MTLPTMKEVRRMVGSLCGRSDEVLEVEESWYGGDGNGIELRGVTADGERVYVRLVVAAIEHDEAYDSFSSEVEDD